MARKTNLHTIYSDILIETEHQLDNVGFEQYIDDWNNLFSKINELNNIMQILYTLRTTHQTKDIL